MEYHSRSNKLIMQKHKGLLLLFFLIYMQNNLKWDES